MSRKLTIDEVKRYVDNKGAVLISTEYKNMSTDMKFMCSCGKHFTTTFGQFKNDDKNICEDCIPERTRRRRLESFNKRAKLYIENKGCKLITEWIESARAKLDIMCACGDIYVVDFNKFKSSNQTRCRKCNNRTDWDSDSVERYVSDKSDCRIIGGDFVNIDSEMEYRCGCGEVFTATYRSFLFDNRRRCDICRYEAVADSIRHKIEDVARIVRETSTSKLLTETDYESRRDLLLFECECGRRYSTSFESFKSGKRMCNTCATQTSSMERIAEQTLQDKGVLYEPEYTFSDLRGVNNGMLRFDFAVLDKNEDILFLLELDGIQHFEPIEFLGGEDKYLDTVEHDRRKNEYCDKNNIDLLRISYLEEDDIPHIIYKTIDKYDNPVSSLY